MTAVAKPNEGTLSVSLNKLLGLVFSDGCEGFSDNRCVCRADQIDNARGSISRRDVRVDHSLQEGTDRQILSQRHHYTDQPSPTIFAQHNAQQQTTVQGRTHVAHTTKHGKAYGEVRKVPLVPPSQRGSRPYGRASSPPIKVPRRNPVPKAGDRMEKIRARLVGWESSAAHVLTKTPVEFSPTSTDGKPTSALVKLTRRPEYESITHEKLSKAQPAKPRC